MTPNLPQDNIDSGIHYRALFNCQTNCIDVYWPWPHWFGAGLVALTGPALETLETMCFHHALRSF